MNFINIFVSDKEVRGVNEIVLLVYLTRIVFDKTDTS